ncbi:ATP1A2 Sodium/potassium-transporting ATPase subunit alpha-2 [Candida maltosa Xu316]
MKSTCTESSISKIETQQEENIRFDDAEIEEQRGRTRARQRRFSLHSRHSSASKSRIFPIGETVEPGYVLPTVFKTISQNIDIENNQPEQSANENKTKFSNYTYHTDTIGDIMTKFSTDLINGLSESQYKQNLKTYGLNKQSKPPSGLLKKIFMYFFGGFGALLLAGGILCIICWKPLGSPPAVSNLVLGIILLVVFLIQAGFNFIQDYSSSRVMESIHSLVASETMCIRQGQKIKVESQDLVPGDIILFAPGVKIPADARIINLSFDRAILTGESKPIAATSTSDPLGPDSNYLESSCIAMQGTFCLNGTGRAIVVSTGDETIFGSIAKMTSAPKTGLSPIQYEIFRFVAFISLIIVFLAVLVVVIWCAWLHRDYPDWINVANLIISIVSFAISTIPESLPVSISFVLLLTASKMKQQQILVKSLHMCGTLASCSVLCFDKTGTLTQNNMKVTLSCIGDQLHEEEWDGEKNDEDDHEKSYGYAANHLFTIGALCNEAAMVNESPIGGNATDRAILQFVDHHCQIDDVKDKWVKKLEISFNSKDKYMLSLVEPATPTCSIWNDIGFEHNENFLLLVKAAPDVLIDNCQMMMNENGTLQPMTDEQLQYYKDVQKKWSTNGKRVILFASKLVHKDSINLVDRTGSANRMKEETQSGLIFMGLVGIEDPPRKNIEQVIATLRDAGIKIVMITGDYELTGVSIAKQCGIITDENTCKLNTMDIATGESISIVGSELNSLTDDQWEKLVQFNELVFTRTTPEHKLLIIEKFQKYGQVVGMTGDGINDAPALKQADIGISILDASDIAKEAADLILMNSSADQLFLSIIEALKFGRLVFENLKKTICYLLPAGSYSELWPVIMNVFFGMPQMLSSFLMIIICCLTDCVGSIVLAYESPESNLLKKKPRIVTGERLVNFKLLFHAYICVGTFYTFTSFMVSFLNLTRRGLSFEQFALSFGSYEDIPNVTKYLNMSSSIYFVNLIIMQMFNLMTLRTRHLSFFQHSIMENKKIIFVPPFVLMVNFIINYIPAIQRAMGTAQVPVEYYFIAVGFGLVVFTCDEIRKLVARKYPNGFIAKIAW